MELSRDVERALLSCPVWPLEGVKFDYLFTDIWLNLSKTVSVSSVKFVQCMPLKETLFLLNITFFHTTHRLTLKNKKTRFSTTDFESTSCPLPFKSRKWLLAAREQKMNHFHVQAANMYFPLLI